MIGKIHPKGTMFLREHVGTAETKDGIQVEMSLANFNTPLIQCQKTGKSFTLSWADILDLAMKAGVAEPFAEAGDAQ